MSQVCNKHGHSWNYVKDNRRGPVYQCDRCNFIKTLTWQNTRQISAIKKQIKHTEERYSRACELRILKNISFRYKKFKIKRKTIDIG